MRTSRVVAARALRLDWNRWPLSLVWLSLAGLRTSGLQARAVTIAVRRVKQREQRYGPRGPPLFGRAQVRKG